jgi:hypothetical protein
MVGLILDLTLDQILEVHHNQEVLLTQVDKAALLLRIVQIHQIVETTIKVLLLTTLAAAHRIKIIHKDLHLIILTTPKDHHQIIQIAPRDLHPIIQIALKDLHLIIQIVHRDLLQIIQTAILQTQTTILHHKILPLVQTITNKILVINKDLAIVLVLPLLLTHMHRYKLNIGGIEIIIVVMVNSGLKFLALIQMVSIFADRYITYT